jgi:hypothetical protein
VRQALGQLPASQREAVILRHVAGLSEAAAAQDEELDAILAALCGDLDDAELDHRTARFRGALRRLREDPAEATTNRECLRVVAAARKSERLGTKLDQERQVAHDTTIEDEILIAERNAALRAAFAELPSR